VVHPERFILAIETGKTWTGDRDLEEKYMNEVWNKSRVCSLVGIWVRYMAQSVAGKPKKMLTKSIVWLWKIDLDEKTYTYFMF